MDDILFFRSKKEIESVQTLKNAEQNRVQTGKNAGQNNSIQLKQDAPDLITTAHNPAMLNEVEAPEYTEKEDTALEYQEKEGTKQIPESLNKPVFTRIKTIPQDQQAAEQANVEAQLKIEARRITEGDNSELRKIRQDIDTYYEYKEILDRDSRDHNLSVNDRRRIMESAMSALYNARQGSDLFLSSKWNRFVGFFFSTQIKKVKDIQREIKKEDASISSAYSDLLDEMKEQGIEIRTDHADDEYDDVDYKMNTKGVLKFSDLAVMDESDKGLFASKNLLRMRAENDLSRALQLPADQKLLLSDIAKYAAIKSTSTLYRIKESSSVKNAMKKESELVQKIRTQLNTMLSDQILSNEARKRLIVYKEYFDGFADGNLVVPQDAQVIDMSAPGIQYYDSKINRTKNIVASRKRITCKDRSAEPLFAHEPCVSDVAQDKMGNCYLLSALARIVSLNPSHIKDMMKEEDGKVTVRFYKQEADNTFSPVYVRVDKKTYEKTGFGSLWVQIYCKAYAAFMAKYSAPDINRYSNHTDVLHNRYYRDGVPADVIDYGFVRNGGWINHITNCALGGRYREQQFMQVRLGNRSTTTDFLRYEYRTASSASSQANRLSTGMIYEEEYASYTIEMKNYNSKNLMYYKKAHETAVKNAGREIEDIYTFFREHNAEKEAEISTGKNVKMLLEIITGNLNGALKKKFGRVDAFELMCSYAAGCHNIPPQAKEIGKSCWEYVLAEYDGELKTPEFWLLNGHSGDCSRLLKRIPKNLMLNELKLFGKANRLTELTGLNLIKDEQQYKSLNPYVKFETRINNFMEYMTDDRKNEVIQMGKDEILRLTGRCIAVIERSVSERPTEEMLQSYLATLTLDTYRTNEVQKDVESPLNTLANAVGCTDEEAFEMIKTAIKQRYTIYQELKNEQNTKFREKTDQIFSGFYTGEALDFLQRIRTAAANKEPMLASSTSRNRMQVNEQGIVTDHAYSIMGARDIMFRGKRIHMIKIRNPWGYNGVSYKWDERTKTMNAQTSTTAGIFYMELTHFMKLFTSIA